MAVDQNVLLQKFKSVSNSQENIQSLSLWLIHHKNHSQKIIESWHKTLSQSGPSHRLTLFYLANDVIQNSKKKGISVFVEGFEEILRHCMSLLMDEKIRNQVVRVLNIWSERGIFRQSFIEQLKSAAPYTETVSNESSATTKIMAEFKMRDVVEAVSRLQRLENESQAKIDDVKGAKLAALNSEILTHLKDKTLGDHLIREADDASRLLQDAIAALEREQSDRRSLIECLDHALVYTVVQNNEVGDEFQAFIRIGQNAAKILTILTMPRSSSAPFLPLPSDVPSPTNSDDGPILPSDPIQGKHTSSLDQRLETILCAMTVAPPNPRDLPPAATAGGYHPAVPYEQDQHAGNMNQMPSAPPGASRITAQPIQSLISSRPGISQAALPSVHGIMNSGGSANAGYAHAENCEPADMDITNSDDEEYVPGPRGPNLRIIEPVRSIEAFMPDDRRMPDPPPAPYPSKSRPRDTTDNGAWHRIPAGERSNTSRSPHHPHPAATSVHRWNPPASRSKQSDHSRTQGGRRTGNFIRHH